jgi:hypothetical protein
MIKHMSKRTVVNGVNLHYVVAGEGPVVLGMRGWLATDRRARRPVSIYRALKIL